MWLIWREGVCNSGEERGWGRTEWDCLMLLSNEGAVVRTEGGEERGSRGSGRRALQRIEQGTELKEVLIVVVSRGRGMFKMGKLICFVGEALCVFCLLPKHFKVLAL